MTYIRGKSGLPGSYINAFLAVRKVKGREGLNMASYEVQDTDQKGLERRTGEGKMKGWKSEYAGALTTLLISTSSLLHVFFFPSFPLFLSSLSTLPFLSLPPSLSPYHKPTAKIPKPVIFLKFFASNDK